GGSGSARACASGGQHAGRGGPMRAVPARRHGTVRKSYRVKAVGRLRSRPRKVNTEMKVVLFCGGLGTRLRDYSESIPKPMVPIGYRPILWHLMKYYAHFGHREFILCLGYRADVIKQYFLNYDECLS